MTCECCGKDASLTVSRWICQACPMRHVLCLVCLGKASAMQGVGTGPAFLTCPKSLVVAYDLAPFEDGKVRAAIQWTVWWTDATR